jgi:hypothetical protein
MRERALGRPTIPRDRQKEQLQRQAQQLQKQVQELQQCLNVHDQLAELDRSKKNS